MGGGAFAQARAPGEPTLKTPRMSPEEYTKLKDLYLGKLQGYFATGKVACLIETPEKESYGDIDIFVALQAQVDFVQMANAIHADALICHSSGRVQSCTLGVRKDGTPSSRRAVLYKHVQDHGGKTNITEEEYAQIDVEIVSPELLEWHTFYSSYGDMAGLLGHTVTNLGFTVSDRGFWLRMKELDASKLLSYVNVADRDGMLLLSSDPEEVMAFLGLSPKMYHTGFTTLEMLYSWVGGCRLLLPEAVKIKRDNAHERNRENKRTIFFRFFNEWLPAHVDMDQEKDDEARKDKITSLRQGYAEEAVEYFSKREEYELQHNALAKAVNNAVAANLIRPIIAKHSGKQNKQLNELVRGFRRYCTFEQNRQAMILTTPNTDTESELHKFLSDDGLTLRDPCAVDEWVKENWEELKVLERHRAKPGVD